MDIYMLCVCVCVCVWYGKSRITGVCETQFILVLFIDYCIIFHTNNYKRIFASPCIYGYI